MRKPNKRQWFPVSRILPLALCLCLAGEAFAQGLLPSLENFPDAVATGITPISELTGLEDTVPAQPVMQTFQLPTESNGPMLDEEAPPPIPQAQAPEAEQPTLKPRYESAVPVSDEQPQPRLDPQAEIPAVDEKPAKFKFSWANLGVTNPFQKEGAIKPISYSPLPGIVVFPVVKHGNEAAFGDLSLVFAREYALRMEQKVPETRVYHPIYTVDELRIRGMGHVYDQVMSYYIKAGRPEPTALDYLLKQLGVNGNTVSRVVFVEADLDTGRPELSSGMLEKVKALMTDGTPSHMKYLVRGRLQIFDAEKPDFPMVWAGSWNRTIRNNEFTNVTPSVFADSDSQQAFARLSRQMSRELLYVTPKEAYMAPLYDMQVQGNLVSGKEQPFPNFTEANPARNPLSTENKQAIQRILQRQNAISP